MFWFNSVQMYPNGCYHNSYHPHLKRNFKNWFLKTSFPLGIYKEKKINTATSFWVYLCLWEWAAVKCSTFVINLEKHENDSGGNYYLQISIRGRLDFFLFVQSNVIWTSETFLHNLEIRTISSLLWTDRSVQSSELSATLNTPKQ